jgi:hypothetical protein
MSPQTIPLKGRTGRPLDPDAERSAQSSPEHHRSGYLPCETRSFRGEGLKLPAEVSPYQQTWQDTVVDARQ